MMPAAQDLQIILPFCSITFLLLSFKRSIYGVLSYFIILNAKLGDMYPILGAIRFELLAALLVLISIPASGGDFAKALPVGHYLNKRLWILFLIGMLSVIQSVDMAESWTLGGYNLVKLVCFYVMIVASVRGGKGLAYPHVGIPFRHRLDCIRTGQELPVRRCPCLWLRCRGVRPLRGCNRSRCPGQHTGPISRSHYHVLHGAKSRL